MKRFFFSFVCLFLLINCSDPLLVESVNPEFLQGKWVTKSSALSNQDTVLSFFSSGSYSYSISRRIDSLSRDTSYWERGEWNVSFVDYNHNKNYDNDSEENHLFTSVGTSNIPTNIGRSAYSMFKYSKFGGRELLELSADAGVLIATFEKDTTR